MLTIKNLSKTLYQGNKAVKIIDNLSLEVKKGELFGFLGPNGAGKTTTAKLITDLLTPDTGEIRINGLSHFQESAKKLYGFMPEQPQFYRHLSAQEALRFFAELFSLEPAIANRRIDQLLSVVGLRDVRNVQVRKFSKGMHQRLAFASALINEPELLILDEPLDGLDPLGRLDFKQLLLDQKKKKTTIFLSSHILADVEELCDHIAIVDKGVIIERGRPVDLIKKSGHRNLEEMFVARIRQR